jgi:hypothetical protein
MCIAFAPGMHEDIMDLLMARTPAGQFGRCGFARARAHEAKAVLQFADMTQPGASMLAHCRSVARVAAAKLLFAFGLLLTGSTAVPAAQPAMDMAELQSLMRCYTEGLDVASVGDLARVDIVSRQPW